MHNHGYSDDNDPVLVYSEDLMLERFPEDWNYIKTDQYLKNKGYLQLREHPDYWVRTSVMDDFLSKDHHLSYYDLLKYFGIPKKENMDFLESLMRDLGYSMIKTRAAFVRRKK